MASVLNTWLAKEYIDLVSSQEGVVVLGLHGLTVEETQQVRNVIREAGASLRVVKNRIAQTALAEAGIGIDESAWDGSCAILAGDAEATLGASKAIRAMFTGDAAERLRFQGALLDGSLMDAAQASLIPSMPDRQTLRGQLATLLTGSARQFATLLSEVPASTARAISARVDGGEADS